MAVKILLSAFACDPSRGSEFGLGWRWAYELSRSGHEVWVLTRPAQRDQIELALSRRGCPQLHVEYVSVPFVPYCVPLFTVYPYYACWQVMAYLRARRLQQRVTFDVVHHVTFGVFRHSSYLYALGIPFVFGPVGGGERAPYALRASMSLRDQCRELLRDIANVLPQVNPLWRLMLRRATRISVRTEETRKCLPKRRRAAAVLSSDSMVSEEDLAEVGEARRSSPLKLLFAGRLLGWKGLHLAVRALARVRGGAEVSLTIVGRGEEERRLKREVLHLGLTNCITFLPWIPKDQVLKLHSDHDAFIFPSLHDSGGTVVKEALSRGKPVICLDLGGPAVMVDSTCAKIVSTQGKNEDDVVIGLATAIEELVRMPDDEWLQMCKSAVERARSLLPAKLIPAVYGPLLLG
jgi:glycosyltransferase involved in cell wall biosynthesis